MTTQDEKIVDFSKSHIEKIISSSIMTYDHIMARIVDPDFAAILEDIGITYSLNKLTSFSYYLNNEFCTLFDHRKDKDEFYNYCTEISTAALIGLSSLYSTYLVDPSDSLDFESEDYENIIMILQKNKEVDFGFISSSTFVNYCIRLFSEDIEIREVSDLLSLSQYPNYKNTNFDIKFIYYLYIIIMIDILYRSLSNTSKIVTPSLEKVNIFFKKLDNTYGN